jgi:acyl-CoA thioesterase I
MKRILLSSAVLLLFTVGASAQTVPVPAPPVAPAPPAPTQTPAQIAAQIRTMSNQLADWPQLRRYAAANAALPAPTPGEPRIVFYGDSITDAWHAIGTTAFSGKPYINRGISGQTTPQMLVRFRQDVVNLHPQVVLILAGTNDIAGNTGPSTQEMIEDNFASMADIAKANHIRVVFSSVLPAYDYPWKTGLEPAEKIRALNAWMKSYCAANHIVYLDYYSALTDEKGGMKEGTSRDGVHPTPAGYAIMEPLAAAAIAQALAQPQR